MKPLAETPVLSIVIPCRNEKAHIATLLDSLLQQDLDGVSWEAIVADGMSDDGTREVLASYCARYPEVRMIDNPARFVSPGLNAGIRAARGSIIMRMDAHTSYAPDYCRLCLETLESAGADNVGGPARTRAEGTLARAIAAAYHSPFSTGGARFHDEGFEGWVDTVTYGCWRKETLERLGLFDEALVRNQDDELNLRLLRSGGRIWQNPAIRSWYSPRPELRSLFRQYFQYGFWKVAVIRKHRIPGSWRHLVPITFILTNAALIGAAIVGSLTGAGRYAQIFASLWLVLASLYAGLLVVASLITARRAGWAAFSYLPVVFATFHVSYGLGFLSGLRWLLPGSPFSSAAVGGAFTELSR
jgi:glycosyltransferase involved in cell wall biosynthesis